MTGWPKMTSMNAGYNRAAVLKQAARRSHFVSRIEIYEAKVKQERRSRGLLGDQRSVMVPLNSASVEQQPAVEGNRTNFTGKAVSSKNTDAMSAYRTGQYERKRFPQQKAIKEQRESSTEQKSVDLESRRVAIAGKKVALIKSEGAEVPSRPAAAKVNAVERKLLAKDSTTVGATAVEMQPISAIVELDVAATAAILKIRLKTADMAPTMQKHAFRCARETLDSLMNKIHSKRAAFALKKEFDKAYGPAWHCIVGTSFGSYVTHSFGGFIYFSIDKTSVLLFKTTVKPVYH
eukprot:c9423_g2_i1 orf=468-1340(+)